MQPLLLSFVRFSLPAPNNICLYSANPVNLPSAKRFAKTTQYKGYENGRYKQKERVVLYIPNVVQHCTQHSVVLY